MSDFFCMQVGIAKEKVVNIGRLSDLVAAELFIASAPREVCTVFPSICPYPFALALLAILLLYLHTWGFRFSGFTLVYVLLTCFPSLVRFRQLAKLAFMYRVAYGLYSVFLCLTPVLQVSCSP